MWWIVRASRRFSLTSSGCTHTHVPAARIASGLSSQSHHARSHGSVTDFIEGRLPQTRIHIARDTPSWSRQSGAQIEGARRHPSRACREPWAARETRKTSESEDRWLVIKITGFGARPAGEPGRRGVLLVARSCREADTGVVGSDEALRRARHGCGGRAGCPSA